MADAWQVLVEQLSDPVVVVDDAQVVRYASQAAARLLGGRNGLYGRSLAELVHPEDVERVGEVLAARPAGVLGSAVRFLGQGGGWHSADVLSTRVSELAVARVLGLREQDREATGMDVASVLDSLREVVFRTDAGGNWTYLNPAWTDLTGFGVDATLGTNFLDYVHPAERESTIALFTAVVAEGRSYCHHEGRYRTADGGFRRIELRATVVRDDQGRVVANAGTIVDLTERRRAEELLAAQNHVLELIATNVAIGEVLEALSGLVARFAGVGAVVRRNDCWADPPDSSAPPPPAGLVIPVRSGAEEDLGSIELVDPSAELSAEAVDVLERAAHLTAIALERWRAEQEVQHRALHDPLTGLPNRTLVDDRLRQALAWGQRHGTLVALLLIDLDRFKEVNDALGHHVGDQVLREIAGRLDAEVRQVDTLGRLGGDEFAAVLTGLEEGSVAERVAERVLAVIRPPVEVGGVVLPMEASVGIALAPVHAGEAGELQRLADAAMYRAKRSGGGWAMYEPRTDRERGHSLAIAGELRTAISDDQLVLHYQPKVELGTGRVVAVEALLRWRHPARGMILPDQFIPAAERVGLIKAMARWVIDVGLGDLRQWRDQGVDLGLAVNLSAVNLLDPDLAAVVAEALHRAATPADRLEVEITESALLTDKAREALQELADIGVGVAIDDFGTGWSSLVYLEQLPARSIKLDRSFVSRVATDERNATIVRSTTDLAHNLGMTVVGEGVETEAVRDCLAELGCDEAQGWYLGRPMAGEQVVPWLAGRG